MNAGETLSWTEGIHDIRYVGPNPYPTVDDSKCRSAGGRRHFNVQTHGMTEAQLIGFETLHRGRGLFLLVHRKGGSMALLARTHVHSSDVFNTLQHISYGTHGI